MGARPLWTALPPDKAAEKAKPSPTESKDVKLADAAPLVALDAEYARVAGALRELCNG